MARKVRAAMADMRALEEQAERSNPVAPSTKRKAVKGGAAVKERATVKKMADRRALEEQSLAAVPGTGATPTTGLSASRGGRKRMTLKKALAEETPSLHNAMEDEMALMPSGEYDGAGKHTLLDHLAAPMKGFGDYLHAMEGGLETGRYQGEGTGGIKAHPIAGATQKARNWLAHRLPMVRAGTMSLESAIYAAQHALQLNLAEKRYVEGELRRRGIPDPEETESDEEAVEVTGGGATPSMGLSQFRGGATTAQKEKAGREYRLASLKAHKLAHKALSLEGGMAMGQVVGGGKADKIALVVDEMEGGALRPMMCDDMPDVAAIGVAGPKGRKKRAPAGPDDGRRKRAAVVKRIMAERGLSMIEASKYVKEHNLYPGPRDSAGAASGPVKRPPPGRPTAAQAAAVRRRALVNPGGPEARALADV
jgi:hypothetical protein